MTQERTFDFAAPRKTSLLNGQLEGIIPKGVYAGYKVTETGPQSLSLDINLSGVLKSIVFTSEGIKITEDTDLLAAVTLDVGDANPRIDVIVIDHTYSQFNNPATYSVVKGTPAVNPSKPAISASQIELATVCVPVSAAVITDADITNVVEITLEGGGDVSLPDIDSLRVMQHSPLNDQVTVLPGSFISTDGSKFVEFPGGDSPTVPPISVDPRIDVLVIDDMANLSIISGVEDASPVPPIYPSNAHPLAEWTVTSTTSVLIKQSDIKDTRPLYTFTNPGVNPSEEFFSGTGAQTVFPISNFVYTTGQNEINVYVDGDHQRSGASWDYVESGTTEITFNTPPASMAKIEVYHIGRAESRNRFHPIVQEFAQDAGGTLDTFNFKSAFRANENELMVFLNGSYQKLGASRDYIELTGSQIQFNTNPPPLSKIVIIKLGAAIGTDNFILPQEEMFVATALQTVFDISDFQYYPGRFELEVYVDGAYKCVGPHAEGYVETDIDTITFNTGINLGQRVCIRKIGVAAANLGAHATSHQIGGSDELDLGSMQGLTNGGGITLLSPGGIKWKITVTDAGSIITTLIP
jgi:hypothetical protein